MKRVKGFRQKNNNNNLKDTDNEQYSDYHIKGEVGGGTTGCKRDKWGWKET